MTQAAVTPGIDSTDKARQVAEAWLQVVQARAFDVGDVHDIDQIFVVNIVHKEATDKLRDQLIIRKTDGYTFPVFPFGIPQMTAMVEMPGMGGMFGMPGMGGMYGMPGMGGMYGMPGMGMQGTPGMGGMRGMPGMGGTQGMPGMSAEESKTE